MVIGSRDYGAAFVAALAVGAASTALAWLTVFAMWPGGLASAILATVLVSIVAAPVWLFGLLLVGFPLWLVLERLGATSAIAAAMLGGLLVGPTWLFCASNGFNGFGQSGGEDLRALAWGAAGAACGIASGYAGWRAGVRKVAL